MQSFNFALILRVAGESEAGLEDSLYSAGCDDALLGFRGGVAFLEFDRVAVSFEAAVLSAITSVRAAGHGLNVSHVEPSDVVNASEIARRLGWTREYIRLLIQGSRGRGKFPTPIGGVTGKACLWSWTDVSRWLLEQGKQVDTAMLECAEIIRDTNLALQGATLGMKRDHRSILPTAEPARSEPSSPGS